MSSRFLNAAFGSNPTYTAFERANYATKCLNRNIGMWRDIAFQGGLDAMCCPASMSGGEPPWIIMPPQGVRLQQVSAINLPGVEGVEVPIISLIMPEGYDGVITLHLQMYNGTGFVEFSGDLNWRIRLNQWYVKDYGNMQTSLGNLQTPIPLSRGGIRLKSLQKIVYSVTLGTGALGRLAGGKIIAGLFGWRYPVG